MAIQQSHSDCDHKGCFVVNTTIEFIPNEKEFSSALQDNKKQFEALFHSYLKKGVKKGQISNDKNLKAIATLFFTFYNGNVQLAHYSIYTTFYTFHLIIDIIERI